ncbi:hypothetical protein MMC30_001058 [Trapelia coarctata]|nr:hypothetical protein [Trapelia coarctata]
MAEPALSPPSLTPLSLHATLASTNPPRIPSSAPATPSSPPPLSSIRNIATHVQPPTIPPHRSHSPSNNLKRSEPFQFGSRYLEENDNVFEFNAWDRVDPSTDTLYTDYMAQQYAFQREHAVSAFDASRFNTAPEKWWDRFYANNTSNFFKDRKWLRQEFPVLDECTRAPTPAEVEGGTRRNNVILEVGAGAGNTAFPILQGNENPGLVIHTCDFSKKAVQLIRNNPAFDGQHIRSEVWDVASTTQVLPPGVEEGSVDVVILIFIFSALSPSQWSQAVRNIWAVLRPGGEVCFRDYGRGDLAQVRFKKGRWLGENFYVRGDGTRVYFFAEEELRGIWGGNLLKSGDDGGNVPGKGEGEVNSKEAEGKVEGDEGQPVREENGAHEKALEETLAFEIVNLGADRRLLVNRQKQLKMYRCWMQGRFRKLETSNSRSQNHGLKEPQNSSGAILGSTQ